MATYIDSDAAVFGFGTTSGSTPTFTQGSTDRYIFGGVGVVNFGAFTIDQLKYGGSGGTTLPAIISDQAFYGGAGLLRAGDIAPGPSGTSDVYGAVSASLQVGVGGVAYDGVDQTTPLSDATSASGIEGGVTTEVASVVIPNCTSGQTIVAFVYAASESFSISAFTAITGTTIRAQALGGTGEEFGGVAILEKVAASSGSITIEVNCNCTVPGAIAWAISGGRINDAAGGGTSHPSTGALAAQDAVVAGTAARTRVHPSTGALAAQAATVSGTATHLNQHPSTGALAAQSAAVAGTAARTRQHPSEGALTAQAATVAGTATRFRAHPATGSLVAQDAMVAGDATVTPAAGPHLTTGDLQAQAATVSGIAEVIHLAPIVIFDGHDGGKEPKKKAPDFKQYKEAKARLRKQIESAFTSEEPSEVKEVKAQAEKVLAETISKQDIAAALETIKLLESALESAQDEEDLLNILL